MLYLNGKEGLGMEELLVTHVELPGENDLFGLFKVKGIEKTIFCFQITENNGIKVDK